MVRLNRLLSGTVATETHVMEIEMNLGMLPDSSLQMWKE